jgi:hypothetical protein
MWHCERKIHTVAGYDRAIAKKSSTTGARGRAASRFSRVIVAAIDRSKILGVRAGARSDHRFIGIWAVVVEDRVFARSWTLTAGGWYRTLLEDPLGVIQVDEREIRMQAVPIRSQRLHEAIEQAYAAKYATPGSRKYVRGFRTPRRRATTVEFRPRSPA